ncbi:MAG TPA: glycosyltransferase family 39 protein [Bryobacteraceae bacterium]|nr:glycosyltransferase family 39 protein [Bryobacteraceae bacterium]
MTLLFLALAWLAGFSLLRFLFPVPLRVSLHNLWLLSLGAGVGIGMASSLYFLTMALAGPNIVVLAAVEGIFLVAAVVLALRAKPRAAALDWANGPEFPWYLTALFLAGAALAAILFVTHSAAKPHGEWDAWSIWNLRARFLYRGGELWKNAFSTQIAWSHPDYPLLVPGIIALCWTLAHGESTLAPIGVAFLFTFGAAGVLISVVGILRGKAQGLIAGALLLGTVGFVAIGAMQYADVPLGFAILATLALLCLEDRYPGDLRFPILAGLTAGFAAWTKNEGLMFVLAILVARAVAILRYGNRTNLRRQLGALAGGLAFPLATVAFFKLRFAPPNDLTATAPREMLTHLVDFGRWITVLEGFVKAVFGLGDFLLPIAVLLALYAYLVRFHSAAEDRVPLATVLAALGVMVAGDLAVYVLLPNDVNWQVTTSVDRLVLQIWPAALLAFFLAANAPQLAAKPKVAEKSKPARHPVKSHRRAAG